MEIICKNMKVVVKSIDVENKTITAVVSHIKTDRDGDILPPEAFKKRIKSYKAHPILLVNHSYKTEDHIGQAKTITLGNDAMEAKLEYFAGKTHTNGEPMNPKADWAWELAQKGLASFSIGFKGFDYDWIKEKDGKGNEQITGRQFKDAELLEISHVVVPAQALALQAMIDNPDSSVEERELCELIVKTVKEGKLTLPTIDPMKDVDPQQVADNQVSELDKMNKRISAVETSVNQAMAQCTKLEGEIDEMEERLIGMEQTAAAGSPSAADQQLDPATGLPKPKHYSSVKVDYKTKVDTSKTLTPKRLRLDLSSIKQTLTDTQKELKTL